MDVQDRELSASYRKAISNDGCFYCGAPGAHDDHFYPLAKGGTDHWFNLVRSCAFCNMSKGAHCGTWWILKTNCQKAQLVSVGELAQAGAV